jgi:predicted PurR-regulated permease PerM/methylmalonyl-CoA mutase cobalamin-binding subunit
MAPSARTREHVLDRVRGVDDHVLAGAAPQVSERMGKAVPMLEIFAPRQAPLAFDERGDVGLGAGVRGDGIHWPALCYKNSGSRFVTPPETKPAAPERARDTARPLGLRPFRPLIVLASLALIFACLHLARGVLIPVAFAMLLALALTPLVTVVQRRGVHRIVAVLVVVLLVFAALGAVLWVLGQQVVTLANDLPLYRHNIREKVADIRVFGRGGSIEKVQETVQDVAKEMQKDDKNPAANRPPIAVVPADKPGSQLVTLATVGESAATVGFVMVLVVFLLIERQELRNRLIRLFGHGRITVTTQALDDATRGIIRYLLMQSLVNTCFGIAVAGGLWLLGVPYPFLWGTLAGLLRFIPYVGTWMAALLPIALSLAVFPGWTKPLMVVGLFAVLEAFIFAVVEPLLYGHSIGVSQTALLVAVAFWTWLWGPLGLILATPLTVCLVVLGKYVSALDFILTLVSDRPALTADVAYYQRLIAMDRDEAAEIVETQLPTLGVARIYDEMMVPALYYARRDHSRARLTDEQFAFVVRASREIADDVVAPTIPGATAERGRVLGCPGQDEADEAALHMLGHLLAPSGVSVQTLSAETLTGEVVAAVEQAQPSCICVASLPPGGMAHTRYLLKRVRARFQDVGIVVGRWGVTQGPGEDGAPLMAAGANRVGTTLAQTRDHILELLPLAAQPTPLVRIA